jgi:hypothetical protein
MRCKRFAIGLAVLVTAIGIVGVAPAFAAKTIQSSGKLRAAPVESAGSKSTLAGAVKDSVSGQGAFVGVSTAAGTTVSGPFTVFFPNGTFRGTFTTTIAPNPDGTVALNNGKLKIKGGTGVFKGVTGTGTFSGTIDKKSVTALAYKAKMKLP